MHQKTFAESGFERYAKRTRRDQFLDEMESVVPLGELCALIEPESAILERQASAEACEQRNLFKETLIYSSDVRS
jgi:hypothetical protein